MRDGASHPLALLALGVLLLNDHVLKAAWGNAFTGKIGDVAVLIIGPVLLAAVFARLGLRKRWAGGLALAFNAVFFTVLQLWPPLGDAWCAVFGGFHTPDPTDLLCLPALALAPLCWRPTARPLRFALPALAVALCATTLTGTYRDPCSWRPAAGTEDHDPNAPLRLDGVSDGYSLNFLDDVSIRRAGGGAVPFEVVLGGRWVLLCPLGGLDPDTEYVWRVGPFENRHPNQLPESTSFPGPNPDGGPHLRRFRTAGESAHPKLTLERCRTWLGRPDSRWGQCAAELDGVPTGRRTGGSGL